MGGEQTAEHQLGALHEHPQPSGALSMNTHSSTVPCDALKADSPLLEVCSQGQVSN